MPSEQSEPVLCRAGCAQQIITPPLGVCLAGYFHERLAKSVRDDLYARAVVLETDGTRLALVACDLISPDAAVTDAARDLIAAETGIPGGNVLICATHTHTGPELRADHAMPAAAEWTARLPRLLADVVGAASQEPFAASLRPGSVDAHGYSFNRLFRMKDGSELFGRRPGQMVGNAGPIDPQLQTLSVVDEQGDLRCLLVHFALHVDVIGGGTADFLSADWPGELAANIAAVYGDHVPTLFLQGTCGDINHHSHQPSQLPGRGPQKAVQLGRALAGAAMHAAERAEPMAQIPLAVAEETLTIPYYTRDESFMAEIAALKAKGDPSDFERYIVEQGEAWPHDGEDATVPVQVMRIGDVGLVGLPAEIFVRIGLEIKHFSPTPHTFVVELANASASTYIPTTDQAERNAYGAKPILSRWLCADAGRRLADAAQVMLWKLWE